MPNAVTVKQDPANEIPVEVLADAIVQVADAAKRLLSSRLTTRAVVLLIHDACGGAVGKRDIQMVLEKSAMLAATYIKKPAVKK